MDSTIYKNRLYHRLISEPESAMEYLDLVYVTDSHLDIQRKKSKNGFKYLKDGRKIADKRALERINKMVIPPAWEAVRITSLENGHLQATGRDNRFRKQYRYHDKWSRIRNQTKFYKMYDFGRSLPRIRELVEQDLKQPEFTKTKVMALIIKLLEETHIRIGNAQYARRNKTYGLSTLRSKHVDIYNNRMKFEFTGKRGKKHSVTVRNKKLIKLVNQCEEIPGWELFKYYDSNGVKHNIDSTMVNNYLKDISSEYFTAKDFRTWAASLICFETLLDCNIAEKEQVQKSNILSALDESSKALGNTRNVVRKYYVHPTILSSYLDGSIADVFEIAERDHLNSMRHFTSSEFAMLELIKKFKLSFEMN